MTKWVQDITIASPDAFAYDASVKPVTDTTSILIAQGYKSLNIQRFGAYNPQFVKDIEPSIEPGDIVVYMSPSYCGREHEIDVANMIHSRGAKIINHVHDINDIRFSDKFDPNYIELMNMYDALVVQSKNQIDWLHKCGLRNDMPYTIQEGPFGYLYPEAYKAPKNHKGIIYTGNMTKDSCGFLEDLAKVNRINIYKHPMHVTYGGPEDWMVQFEPEDNVTPLMLTHPDQLPSLVNGIGGFGLDHKGYDSWQGLRYMEYCKYNWSHKISAYLVAGLPVIVQEQSLAAKYVKEKGLGLVFGSHQSIPHLLMEVSEAEYRIYCANVRKELHAIRTGKYVYDAIVEAELLIQ